MKRETEAAALAADAAYERGWKDSLDAYARHSLIPPNDRYWYGIGWQACADYRWQDRNGRGIAPDRNYRKLRLDDQRNDH